MRELDAATRTALEKWAFTTGTGDWDDVLERAGLGGPAGKRVRWSALAVGVVLLVTLLSVPQFGIGARVKTLLTGSGKPGLQLETDVVRADGIRVGSFSVRTSRLFVTASRGRRKLEPHPFSPAGERLLGGAPITWKLDLVERANQAVLIERRGGRRPVVVARLCKPCSAREAGTVRLRRSAFSALFSRRLVVTVTTPRGTGRGVLALEPPTRR